MNSYVALLRGVNVGGHRKLPMAELRSSLLSLGYANPRTLLASGNLVFEAPDTNPAALEARLEADLLRTFTLQTEVMIRDPAQWDAIIAANPFPQASRADPAHMLVVALKSAPSTQAVQSLLTAHKGPEQIHVHGREAYVFYGDGMADSRLNLKPLGPGTGRNWNTVLKLKTLLTQ